MKPKSKAESHFLYSRNSHPNRRSVKKGESKYLKRQMNKAVRRYFKYSDKIEITRITARYKFVKVQGRNNWYYMHGDLLSDFHEDLLRIEREWNYELMNDFDDKYNKYKIYSDGDTLASNIICWKSDIMY